MKNLSYNRTFVFAAACMGILLFGTGMITLGALQNEIIEKYAISQVAAGSLTIILALGLMMGSLVFGPIVDRYGYKLLLIICSMLVVCGMLGLAFAETLFGLQLAVFLINAGGGALNGGTSALVVDISESGTGGSNLSMLGVFWGIGALGMPFILGILAAHYSYEQILTGTAALMVLPIIYFISLQFPAPKHTQGFPIRKGIAMAKDPTLILIGMILFFQSGLESLVNNWSTNYLENYRIIQPEYAKYALSIYILALTLGRLAVGSFLRKIPPYKVLYFGMLLTFSGTIILLASSQYLFIMIGMILIGAGVAAAFPLILGYVGEIYADLSGTAFSLVFIIALIGNMLINYLMGWVSEFYGIEMMPYMMVGNLALLLVSFALALRSIRTRTSI